MRHRLPDARLQKQVAAALEPDARLEERLERVALAAEAVDDLGACATVSKEPIEAKRGVKRRNDSGMEQQG